LGGAFDNWDSEEVAHWRMNERGLTNLQ